VSGQSSPSGDQLGILEAARADHIALHAMPPEAKQVLAQQGIFTTTEPRPTAESFRAFHDGQNATRMLGRLAANTRTALRRVEGYEDARDNLGYRLAAIFGGVVALHGAGVHEIDPSDPCSTVVARSITFTLKEGTTERHANLLSRTLQTLLRIPQIEYPTTATTSRNERGLLTVTAQGHLSEYAPRVLGAAIEALIAEEDAASLNFAFPPDKRTVATWKEPHRLETFPRVIEDRLDVIADEQEAMEVTADYTGRPDLKPAVDREPLGTDPAAAIERWRKINNGLIHLLRGGSHLNQEQDPDKRFRLMIEKDVNLKRDPIDATEEWKGPERPHAPRIDERYADLRHDLGAKWKEHRTEAIVEALKAGIGIALGGIIGYAVELGADTVLALASRSVGPSKSKLKNWASDYKLWRDLQRGVSATSHKIDQLIARARAAEVATDN